MTNHKLRMHGLDKKFLCQVRYAQGNSCEADDYQISNKNSVRQCGFLDWFKYTVLVYLIIVNLPTLELLM